MLSMPPPLVVVVVLLVVREKAYIPAATNRHTRRESYAVRHPKGRVSRYGFGTVVMVDTRGVRCCCCYRLSEPKRKTRNHIHQQQQQQQQHDSCCCCCWLRCWFWSGFVCFS